VRLRQAVLAAADLEGASATLQAGLGLGEPFHDPGVALFGLANSVFALGDCFIEVVSPVQPETAAGRYMARRGGDCGYMAIFDLEDLDGARARARALGIRTAWEVDLPDISTTHLHPRDMAGAIVSLDRSRPYGTWRWGGPEWTGRVGAGAPGRLDAITIAAVQPLEVAARWAEVLGVPVREGPRLDLDDGAVVFAPLGGSAAHPAAGEGTSSQTPGGRAPAGQEGLVEITVALPPSPPPRPPTIELGALRVRIREAPPPESD
jgi:hypothetical protein